MAQLIKNLFRGHQTEFARLTGVLQNESTHPADALQEKSTGFAHVTQTEEEALKTLKKRKLNPIKHLKDSINKAKILNISAILNSSILDFNFSLSQPIDSQPAGDTPANITSAEVSIMSDITS
jgi:hypothetical protein